jgi:hypothetical protein
MRIPGNLRGLVRTVSLLVFCCMAAGAASAQSGSPSTDPTAKNAAQARELLDAMVKALGGDAWLQMKNREIHGTTAAFYQGKPSSGTTEFWEFHAWPEHDRLEITKHRDYVQLYVGRDGWEIIYSGKKELPKEQLEDYLRRRDRSIETVVKVWLKDPRTMLLYDGQQLAGRHLADEVTLITANNDSVTIDMDSQTHLPLKRSFTWRDPVYHDKDEDTEEYADYHLVDGLPTAYNVTRSRNGELVSERFVLGVKYNQEFPADFWDVDATARKIVKR